MSGGEAPRRDRNSMLLEAGMTLASELSLPAILQRLVELAVELTSARYGALGVLGRDGMIVDFITTGVTEDERRAIGHLPVGRGILGVLIHEVHPLRLRDLTQDPRSVGFPPNHPPMRSFLGAPVVAHGLVYGNLYLTEKQGAGEFTAEDEQALVVLAAQAGVAIDNARLHEQTQRLAVLEDRERIARELHDGAIQALFAAGMNLQGTAMLAGDPEIDRRLQDVVGELDRVIRDLRNYIFGLRPGLLADRQLDTALRELAAELERRSGVTTVVEIDEQVASELAPRATDIVQLAREALSNVSRHANAATCRVSLRRDGEQGVLEVDDDGRGFDPERVQRGQGLGNLSARTASLGGKLEIRSDPAEGTTVSVRIPL
jgi:signal transduction histidine kinase